MVDMPHAPNRLATESSPYLQQHARNPVDWYPWGEEAFEKSRKEDRPIFLSVGYSSCHWCHVMEHESFEDEEVARVLNERFVSIKVDREERPDVDAIYMTAVQMMTGQGGWPMSVFLTPDLKPFYGGTYFPKESMYGRPGFIEVLEHLARLYSQEREKVSQAATEIGRRLTDFDIAPRGDDLPGEKDLELFFRVSAQRFDSTFGGFGGAPKFPHSMDLSLLLRYWQRTGEKLALDIVELTLTKMVEGGMYDQIGGGFHRYSVDRQWLVPHFEKMLYDNALLARTYLEGWQATREPLFLRVGREILDYVIREMTDPAGGFHSATDADSEGEEGKFFVWTPDEVEEALGVDEARIFCLHYDITVGGNFEGKSIPNVSRPIEHIAVSHKLDVAEVERIIADSRKKLYDVRARRVPPFRDEKVIASWSGLMLSAMARGHQVTGDGRYLAAATRAADFIRGELDRDGVLHRIFKDGQTKIPGYLDDYAYVAEGFLDLHEATFDVDHLDFAIDLTERLLREFADGDPGGALFYSSARHTHLIQRRKDIFDNATPSPTWVAAWVLLRLAALTGESRYRKAAEGIYGGLGSLVEKAPMGFATALSGVDFMLGPVLEVAVLGRRDDEETGRALRAIHGRFIPKRVITGADDAVGDDTAARLPLLRNRGRVDGKTTVYLCENFTCDRPLTDIGELERALDERSRAR